ERHGSTTAAPATGLGEIIRVKCRTKHFIKCLRPGAKFGRIGFANGDGTSMAHTLDDEHVLVRYEIGVDTRAIGGTDAFGQEEILVGDGQAVQRAHSSTMR